MRKSPSASGRVAKLLDGRITQLAGRKLLKQIAREAGIAPNNLSQMRYGKSKLPIERAPALALALDVPTARLVRYAMEDGLSAEALAAIYASVDFSLSANERELVELVRESSRNGDTELNSDRRNAIALLFE